MKQHTAGAWVPRAPGLGPEARGVPGTTRRSGPSLPGAPGARLSFRRRGLPASAAGRSPHAPPNTGTHPAMSLFSTSPSLRSPERQGQGETPEGLGTHPEMPGRVDVAAGSGDGHTSEQAVWQCDRRVVTQPIGPAPASAGPGGCWAPRAARSCRAWGEREGGGSCTRRPLPVIPRGQPWAGRRSPEVGQPQGAAVWAPSAERWKEKWPLWGYRCLWTCVRVTPRSDRPQESIKSKCVFHASPPGPRRVHLAEPPS